MTPLFKQTTEQIQLVSQPVVYSVAGATLFGLTVEDWVLVGTLALVVMNLALAGTKLCTLIRGKWHGNG